MKIVFLGTGDFGIPAIRAVRDAGHLISAAISQPDRPAGRGLAVAATPIHKIADACGVSHFQTTDVNTDEYVSILRSADLALVAAFGQKLGPAVLAAPRLGCINIHASLLPKYRGAAPFQWAILNGDAETGVTIFQIDEKWDAGPLWAQRATPIGETETADELHDRLALLGAELAVEALAAIAGGKTASRIQNAMQATKAPKLSKADSELNWSQPARVVSKRINGLWSWPTAACVFESAAAKRERVQLARAAVATGESARVREPGAFLENGAVQCGDGAVKILEIKPAGGKVMPFDAFSRGRDIRPPARFLSLESA